MSIAGKVVEFVTSFIDTSTNVIQSVGDSIAIVFHNIWTFILYNIFSPILMILFLILFFVGQYYLIKLYLAFFKYVVGYVIKAFNIVSQNQKVKRIVSDLLE